MAAEAGVDPALVMHYFGSEAELFALLLPVFIGVWEPRGPLLPMLRAAATNRTAADALLAVFVDQVAPALAAVVSDHAAERVAPVGSQLLGLATARYILWLPALADMGDARLVEWLRPVFMHYLSDPAP